VAKLAANGRRLLYATLLGGRGNTLGSSIAVDKAGAAYVTGATSALDFPTTRGAYQTILKPGDTDAYVTKLSPDGRRLRYSTLLGGRGTTLGNGIALDRAGAAYVTGATNTATFPITRDALPTAQLAGEGQAFVAELAPLGQRLLYATYVGGRGAERGRDVAVDERGAAYLTGETDSHDFPTTRGAFQTVPRAGATDAFVIALAPNRGR
jgi:Beta-propeller repeat